MKEPTRKEVLRALRELSTEGLVVSVGEEYKVSDAFEERLNEVPDSIRSLVQDTENDVLSTAVWTLLVAKRDGRFSQRELFVRSWVMYTLCGGGGE